MTYSVFDSIFEQKACFQLVLTNDYRTGRSYIMFNYDHIGWQVWGTAAQGYLDPNTFVRLYTSYTYLSYSLPILTGNTGKNVKPS